MRVIAMYLPQFHRVRENDAWWGEGFTEWTTVRGAKPLYGGHAQPRVPLDDNYYDLLDKSVMRRQADLMKQYGVNGVCMYHYWFKDGRQILEKPAENLLGWPDIEMPFCFCWANETWARSWSNIRDKNVWADTMETEAAGEGGVLLEQKYGDREQWQAHFDYLLPFFRDSRYITIDGKPVFVIYRSSAIPCIEEMLELWRERAVESGLKGICVIGVWAKETMAKALDAELYHEPVRARFALRGRNPDGVTRYEYDALWDDILKVEGRQGTFYGGFVSYDDTPRRGLKGWLAEGDTPERFEHYLTELMAKNAACGNDIVFLNAWNEWGEGMYLEPDVRYRYGYLRAVLHAKENYRSRIPYYRDRVMRAEQYWQGKSEELENILQDKDKYEHYLNILDAWMHLRERGGCLADWFSEKGYGRIGMYGCGTLGKHFLNEMEGSGVEIVYVADQKRERLPDKIPSYLPEAELPEADIVVVSATFYYGEIYRKLKEKGIRNIISLEQIIGEY